MTLIILINNKIILKSLIKSLIKVLKLSLKTLPLKVKRYLVVGGGVVRHAGV